MAKRSKKKRAIGGGVSTKVPATRPSAQPSLVWFTNDWILGLLLVGAIVLVYLPVWWAGFIWDDDFHLTANPCVVGPLGLKEIWTTSVVKFCPLVFTTFWFEHALWGLAPLPYHVVNVLLHGASALLLWRVLRLLQIPGAWLGAALWALHPVQVESVAWISEMKNTESGVFFLLAILFFAKRLKEREGHDRRAGNWNYGLTLLFAFLAMASKSSTVILPVVLALIARWVEGRWNWRNLKTIAPIFLLSVVAGALTIWNPEPAQASDPQWGQNWPERLVTAGNEVWFYLGKLLWPYPLIVIYPRWEIDAGQWFSYLPLLLVIIISFVLWMKRPSWARPYFLIWAYFLVALLPVLGLIQMTFLRYSFVADHFQYLASMGPLALAGAGMARLAEIVLPGKTWLQPALAAGVLLALGTLTWQRAQAFENEEALWTDTLAKYPDSWTGHNNLGIELLNQGRVDEAMVHFQKALAINPQSWEAYNDLGNAFSQKGREDLAMAEYQKSLEINPNNAEAYNDLGNGLLQMGLVDKAMVEFQKALALRPGTASIYYNLGSAFLQKKQWDEAIAEYGKVLAIDPNHDQAHNNLGVALYNKGELDEAVAQFQEALRLNPNNSGAKTNLDQVQAFARQKAGQK
jgi:Flp pilus assembly protein TadD